MDGALFFSLMSLGFFLIYLGYFVDRLLIAFGGIFLGLVSFFMVTEGLYDIDLLIANSLNTLDWVYFVLVGIFVLMLFFGIGALFSRYTSEEATE